MIFKMLSVVLACHFINDASAVFEIDGQEMEGPVSIPLSDPDKTYSLKNKSEGKEEPCRITRLEMFEKTSENGKFISGSNLTFEEHCLLTASSSSCIETSEPQVFVFDSNIQALKYKGKNPLRVFYNSGLRADNTTIISEESEIVFQGDHAQGNFFLKTPKSISFVPSSELEGGINAIVMKPASFNFKSQTGMGMSSSSAFLSIDINFKTQAFKIDLQCVGSVIISDVFPEITKLKSAPSSPRKKMKTSNEAYIKVEDKSKESSVLSSNDD